jgi:hypothetical protein
MGNGGELVDLTYQWFEKNRRGTVGSIGVSQTLQIIL